MGKAKKPLKRYLNKLESMQKTEVRANRKSKIIMYTPKQTNIPISLLSFTASRQKMKGYERLDNRDNKQKEVHFWILKGPMNSQQQIITKR